MYRQALDGQRLSIEQETPDVPNDGYFYVVHNGAVAGKYRNLKQAMRRYNEIKAGLKLESRSEDERPTTQELIRHDMANMSNKSLLWDSDDYRRVEQKTRGKPKRA